MPNIKNNNNNNNNNKNLSDKRYGVHRVHLIQKMYFWCFAKAKQKLHFMSHILQLKDIRQYF